MLNLTSLSGFSSGGASYLSRYLNSSFNDFNITNNVPWPSGATAGQYVIYVAWNYGGAMSTPSGFTALISSVWYAAPPGNSGGWYIGVWKKQLSSGDISTGYFTTNGTYHLDAVVLVNSDPISANASSTSYGDVTSASISTTTTSTCIAVFHTATYDGTGFGSSTTPSSTPAGVLQNSWLYPVAPNGHYYGVWEIGEPFTGLTITNAKSDLYQQAILVVVKF